MFLFYTPWKHQKTKAFFGVFRGYTMGTMAKNGLTYGMKNLPEIHLLDLKYHLGLYLLVLEDL